MRALMAVAGLLLCGTAGVGETTYQKPPKEILDVLSAAPAPEVSVSPAKTYLLLLRAVQYPPIAEVAKPMLRLAGHRIDPATNGPHLPRRYDSLALVRIRDGVERRVDLPPGARVSAPKWSPDGRRFAFQNAAVGSIQLWVGEAASGVARRMSGVALNAAIADPIDWMADGRRILALLVPAGRGSPPAAPAIPAGPRVQESAGRSGPVRTYQDLLASPHDEALFDYYATAQLALVDVASGKIAPIGKPAVFSAVEPAPDGVHVLVTRRVRPYSYLHPSEAFPKQVEVWDSAGRLVHKVASLPLEDRVPIEGVPVGPRSVAWRPDEPATLVWVEALDGGNPKEKAPHRDRVVMLRAPFRGEPAEVTRVEHRYSGMDWLETKGAALVRDYERNRRWTRTFLLNVDQPSEPPRLLWSRNIRDRYQDPGTPVHKTLPNGRRVIQQEGEWICLVGEGSTPGGDRPFLDRFNLKTRESKRVFRCGESGYERVVTPLEEPSGGLLVARESPTRPVNYFVVGPDGSERALTRFADPAPQLRSIRKQLVKYQRADGVPLSFTLYLPPGYREGTRLPAVVWAYPLEYTDAGVAGQVGGSTQRFTTITGASHLFFLLQGYAILDNAAMPVIGDPETVNNTYLEQIVAGAKAAIDKAGEMAVVDRERVGVGGHSYGGFMTANLLAHSDLFRAGIARSGAYNRTLTPFGFQSERRTLWEAPEVYLRMSPFLSAHKIQRPLLMIHGEADDNTGTFPIQSERLYQAVRGNGGVARLVMLPGEAHSYRARESIEHALYEMVSWFDRYVKNWKGE